ncbi:helix-turn-helix transcriptional regulator [Ktedonobacter sp. SOSP1-85]|uniref:ArsR/SmtB family transcription factor n=1 Tax=Ktedonobacter sp. SOSP1-85 TaxID=2778367 RepID=UPI0019167AB6|nr:winged helix-turn-helix domain-containing protein [Ktedonobacter sp. SOSP1-85]
MNDTPKDVNIAAVAALISDPSRAVMLDALLNKQALPAGELAYRAGISPQTASAHLAKLVDGGLLILKTQGRHRYYALSGPEVAHALEALAVIAPRRECVLCEPQSLQSTSILPAPATITLLANLV